MVVVNTTALLISWQNMSFFAIIKLSASFLIGKEVKHMTEFLITCITAVLAHVAAYYICKWLDGLFADKN